MIQSEGGLSCPTPQDHQEMVPMPLGDLNSIQTAQGMAKASKSRVTDSGLISKQSKTLYASPEVFPKKFQNGKSIVLKHPPPVSGVQILF
jgi:hypothetical protein